RRETIVVRYTGGATVPQLTRLLADAERLSRRRDLGSSDSLLVSADALVGQRRHAEAAKLYEQALARAPQRWAPRGRASEAWVLALSSARDPAACATRAVELHAALRGSVSGANVTEVG